jgi:hypothetical protein
MNVDRDEDRIILGSKRAKCHKCSAPAAVTYATNGKAEFWHAPTDCCDWARDREHRFNAQSREADHRAREAHESAWRNSRYNHERQDAA